MFSKALWLKHFKQGKFAIFGLFLASLLIPLKFNSVEQTYKTYMEMGYDRHFYIHLDLFSNGLALQILLTITLAVLLLGMQRSNQQMDFLFSLPIKRRDIFLNQWVLGAAVLAGTLAFSSLASHLILINSEYLMTQVGPGLLLNYFIITYINLLAIYTFCLMVGMFAGSVISHIGLSFIGLFFPIGMFYLIQSFIRAHTLHLNIFPYHIWRTIGELSEILSLPFSLMEMSYRIVSYTQDGSFWSSLTLVILLYAAVGLISFVVAYFFSHRSKAEHHGKLLLYPRLEPILKVGVVVCFFLLGGMFFADASPERSLVAYYSGGIIIAAISYIVLRMLLKTRFQLGRQG